MADALLRVENLTRRFGGLVAVNGVSFAAQRNEILSIIGPNGAGKSTLFKLIASFLKPSAGAVWLGDTRISGQAPHTVARQGVVRTFQETTIFKDMTVRDNVIIAQHLRGTASLAGYFAATQAARRDEAKFRATADEILDTIGLTAVADEVAVNLPHGSLRALGIAIGLAPHPKVLLLDEPFAGMNEDETQRTAEIVRAVRARGVTILLVEHDVPAVMKISDRIVVLNFGEKIAEGKPREIQNNADVVTAYLGEDDDAVAQPRRRVQ